MPNPLPASAIPVIHAVVQGIKSPLLYLAELRAQRMELLEPVDEQPTFSVRHEWHRRNGVSFSVGTKSAQSSVVKRLRKNVCADGECIVWTGYRNHHGYGRMLVREDGRNRLLAVHRLAYEAFVGPIPEGHDVLHSCDVRNCINPRHLWTGSHTDNMRDMVAKGRHAGQRKGRRHDRGPNQAA